VENRAQLRKLERSVKRKRRKKKKEKRKKKKKKRKERNMKPMDNQFVRKFCSPRDSNPWSDCRW